MTSAMNPTCERYGHAFDFDAEGYHCVRCPIRVVGRWDPPPASLVTPPPEAA